MSILLTRSQFTNATPRKIRETFKLLVGETRLMSYINTFRDGLWPGGKLKPPGIPRTSEERLRTRDEANRKLSALFPGRLRTGGNPNVMVLTISRRSCCQHHGAVKRTPRCPPDICSPTKPKIKPTYSLYGCRRGQSDSICSYEIFQ